MGISEEILVEAQKLIRRHERYAKDLTDSFIRQTRRTGVHRIPEIMRPEYWNIDAGFNPYLVRSNFEKVGQSIRNSIRRMDYAPRNPVSYDVPKSGGGQRPVSVFQVADSAVSKQIYQSLLNKNQQRMSAYSFAYRQDRTVHDAIQHISSDLRNVPRIFVAEYDFSKYFESIEHHHIWDVMNSNGFVFTEIEKHIIDAFLNVGTCSIETYGSADVAERQRGVPQGTSVSLFLANVAAWPLDRALERLGVGFARYADDTLIWSHDYSRLCDAVDEVNSAASKLGAALNLDKSHGISILAPTNAPAEFSRKSEVDFVGYSFSLQNIRIRHESVRRIKRKIAQLIYANLLEAPKRGLIRSDRFAPNVDRDYVVLIYQLRRYLYGDLTEPKLRRYQRKIAPQLHYKGLMSYYPLVDDDDQLRGLDGWMLYNIEESIAVRGNILRAAGYVDLPVPHGLERPVLLSLQAKTVDGDPLDLTIPSFVRVSKILRKAATRYGANAIGNLRASNYYGELN
jgi:hypothetical protein